jgi:type IV secretory pathway VirB10-like protein
MRALLALFLLSIGMMAQSVPALPPANSSQSTPPANPVIASVATPAPTADPNRLVIPSGTKVPIVLKHAISSKGSREGDAVYAETTFPVVLNDRVVIPPGTYVQGRITHIQRAGRLKGRAEVLMHFTTLIYPSGYTVVMPGALQNAPGVDKADVKDGEGTVREDGQTGEKVGKAAQAGLEGATGGAIIGGLSSGSGTGAGIGAGVGGAAGVVIAMLSRGNDVKMDVGTSIEMVIQRDVPLDSTRLPK